MNSINDQHVGDEDASCISYQEGVQNLENLALEGLQMLMNRYCLNALFVSQNPTNRELLSLTYEAGDESWDNHHLPITTVLSIIGAEKLRAILTIDRVSKMKRRKISDNSLAQH